VVHQAAKQEEWEERNRLANQFRALEADEVQFLDSVRERQLQEELERQKADNEELSQFKASVQPFATIHVLDSPPI
jgi:hypothetical protein